MSIFTDILQAGTNSHGVTVDDFNAIATDFLSDGIVGAITNTAGVAPTTGGFACNAQAVPNMSVAVTLGKAYVTGTPTDGVSQRVRVNMDSAENVTISNNTTGGTRYDWVYLKLDPAKMKDPAVSANDVATLVTSRSTSASTDNGTPPTYGYLIAVVTVANGASSIANSTVSDKRGTCSFNAGWPVGSIYIGVTPTNPATLLGFGTWVAFGAGRTLVGIDATQTEFDVVEETGGAKTHTLTTAELAAHTHTEVRPDGGASTSFIAGSNLGANQTVNTGSTGSNTAHNNLQPYIVTYFWKRTA
jgi:hypothetical protein